MILPPSSILSGFVLLKYQILVVGIHTFLIQSEALIITYENSVPTLLVSDGSFFLIPLSLAFSPSLILLSFWFLPPLSVSLPLSFFSFSLSSPLAFSHCLSLLPLSFLSFIPFTLSSLLPLFLSPSSLFSPSPLSSPLPPLSSICLNPHQMQISRRCLVT